MELIDSHCHIQSIGRSTGEAATRSLWAKTQEPDASGVLARAHAAQVKRMICVGCELEDSQLAVDFVEEHKECWASIGVHPHEAAKYPDLRRLRSELQQLAERPKVVAIGECGLDYFYEHSPKEAQVRVLEVQMELALECNLPLIFHIREAFDDFWPIFDRYNTPEHAIRGVLHSFTDSRVNLERAIKHKLYVGVNGISTFTKKSEQIEMYKSIPLENLLLETDSPFLTPQPYRGKICEPYHIRVIAEYLAAERKEPLAVLADTTTANARRLFDI